MNPVLFYTTSLEGIKLYLKEDHCFKRDPNGEAPFNVTFESSYSFVLIREQVSHPFMMERKEELEEKLQVKLESEPFYQNIRINTVAGTITAQPFYSAPAQQENLVYPDW